MVTVTTEQTAALTAHLRNGRSVGEKGIYTQKWKKIANKISGNPKYIYLYMWLKTVNLISKSK